MTRTREFYPRRDRHALPNAKVRSGSRLCENSSLLARGNAGFLEREGIGEQLKAASDEKISQTDPDARSMATSGRETGIVGYAVQTAMDTKHHIVAAHEGGTPSLPGGRYGQNPIRRFGGSGGGSISLRIIA